MGCCGCGGRATSIFAAIFSLVQAIAWIGIAIYGLQLYSCDVTVNLAGSQLGQAALLLLYVVYFFNAECAGNGISVELPDGTVLALNPGITAEPTERTHTWMVVYIALNALWIVTSILLLLGAVANKRGKCGAAMYYPWVLVTGAIIICDVVAAVSYFIDVTNTLGLPDLLSFIGVTPPASWQPDANPTDVLTTIPSIVMGVIFTRFIVLWIINASLFIYVIIAAVAASKAVSQPTNWKRLSKQEMARSSNQTPWLTQRPEEPRENYPRPTSYPQETHSIPPTPYSHSNSPIYHYPDQPYSYVEPPMPPPREGAQYQPPSRSSTQELFQQEALQQETPKSALQQASDYRYALKAMQPNKRFGNQQPPNAVHRSESDRRPAPQELRSQLPWSYFQSRDDVPMRLQNTHEESEDLPPIPVPDYTLHFPKRQRPDTILQDRESPVHGAPQRLTQQDRTPFNGKGRYNDGY